MATRSLHRSSSSTQQERPARVAIYARVSTTDQNTGSQVHDLRRYVKDRGWTIYREYCDESVSGRKESRPALDALMSDARKLRFDAVVCWKFDRLGRSLRHLIALMEEFRELKIRFLSFQEDIDTGSPLGAAIYAMVGSLAQYERTMIVERVRAGLRRAKSEGRKLGRPVVQTDDNRIRLLAAQGLSLREIAKATGFAATTVARRLKTAPQTL